MAVEEQQDYFREAIDHHKNGRLAEAEALFRLKLEQSPYDLASLVSIVRIIPPVEALEFYFRIFQTWDLPGVKEQMPDDSIHQINADFGNAVAVSRNIVVELFVINKLSTISGIIDKLYSLYDYIEEKTQFEMYARMKIKENKLEDAQFILEKLVIDMPNDAEILYLLASVYKMRSLFQPASYYLMQVIKKSSAHKVTYFLDLSWVLARLGQINDAIGWLFCAETVFQQGCSTLIS